MSQALPERAESNQLGVRDDLRWVTKRATTPPAGLPIDNRPPKSSIELRRRGAIRGIPVDMIKVIYCLRRRADLSSEEFQRYWREIHGPLVRRHQAALRIERYVQTHTDHGTLTERLGAFRGSGAPFDGAAEIWYASRESLEAVGRTAEGRAASRELLEDERRFVDLHASCIWVGEEVEIIAGADSRI